MSLRRIEIQEQNLDKLFEKVSKFEEDEIKSHLAKYLCVQASGYLENVMKELIAEYHDSTCRKETANFVNSKMSYFTSINNDNLTDFLKLFNASWVDSYKNSVTDKQIESLNSIISQRHLIAHGNSNRSNISYGSMVKYYQDLKVIVALLRTIIRK